MFCTNAGGTGSQTTIPPLPDDIHDLSAFGGTKGGVIKSPASSPPKDTPSPDSSLSVVSGGDCPCPSLSASSPGGSIPGSGPVQQSQYGMPYSTDTVAQDATPRQTPPDFAPSMFVQTQEQQSMHPSFESGFSVPSEGTQFSSPLQETASQQTPVVVLPRDNLEVDLDALGLPPLCQQPMQYSLYPQLEQFRDVYMGEDTSGQAPQVPQDAMWWKIADDLGI